MFLEKLELLNYRNFLSLSLPIDNPATIFIGPNGTGKTNLLEAFFFACWAASFRRTRPEDPINWQSQTAKIEVSLKNHQSAHSLSVIFKRGQAKTFLWNQKPQPQRQEITQFWPVFYFSAQLEKIISGLPILRRLALNKIISQKYRNFNNLIANYTKLLKGRNFLLRKGRLSDNEAWEEQFIKAGSEMMLCRALMVRELSLTLNKILTEIFPQDQGKYDLIYQCSVLSKEHLARIDEQSLPRIRELFQARLAQVKADEQRWGQTLLGPHRDEFLFFKNGQESRFFSSAGEGLGIVIALKIILVDLVKAKGVSPVILIDDLLAELDSEKSHFLMAAIQKRGQFFIATSREASLPAELFQSARIFAVKEGQVNPWSSV